MTGLCSPNVVVSVQVLANPITGRHAAISTADNPQEDRHGHEDITPSVFLELDLVESTEGHLVWTNTSHDHYIRGNIELTHNGRIKIHKTGYYSIFSAILFDTYSANMRPHRPVVAYHGIKLYRFGTQKTLIFNKTTLGRAVVLPSHTGPLYHRLEAGDEIKIVVNNIILIYDSESNFLNIVYMFDH
ncbi:uncharacterized protein LOC110463349 isoform X1 [Mizuhopecten yessoensis]|uniref:uncharacterized protein LOC110463349 isoform X1 n=1 Tax=Mizuhopecten yessoensis TaxID=6573 RepID=UPI000B45E4F5|nr:uncharacterized protein LOC110463349 isoform X1 [Mizuhopecten yessoensis]